MVEEEPEEAVAVVAGGNGHENGDGHVNGNGQRPLLAPDHLIVTNGRNGRSPQQPALFTNGHLPNGNGHGHERAKSNGAASIDTYLNGKQREPGGDDEMNKSAVQNKPVPAPLPVPRPRLVL